jgi:AcrR family transcriptional regulator
VPEHLTKSDWVRHGLRTLARQGPGGLKVAPMSLALEVSRGSFYWHFRDVSDFRAQVLQTWADATEQVIRELEAEKVGSRRLKHLMRRGFGEKEALDQAVRSWALQDRQVATTVAAVDSRRIAYIADLLVATGVARAKASDRALFVYWAYLGQTMVVDPRHAAIDPASLDGISTLLET